MYKRQVGLEEEMIVTTEITNALTEPAHAQIAVNRTAYILLKLIKDGAIEDNEALLNFAYDIIELASEQGVFYLTHSILF